MKSFQHTKLTGAAIVIALWWATGVSAQDDALLFAPSSSEETTAIIEKVLSADHLILSGGKKIRLIGLNAPDAPRRKTPAIDEYGRLIKKVDPIIPIEEQAFAFAEQLLAGKTVRIEYDTQLQDADLYTLAYIFLSDGTFVNAEILRYGFAGLRIMPPNTKYAAELREAYQEARREKRGLQND